MKADAPKPLALALGLAFGLHALLFALARPKGSPEWGGVLVPPSTRYLAVNAPEDAEAGANARLVRSPVVYALPSEVGFSREPLRRRVDSPRFVLKQEEPERFLAVEAEPDAAKLNATAFVLSAETSASPALPADPVADSIPRFSARRVTLSPNLAGRIEGGVVLPAALNQAAEKPWEALAQVSVGQHGQVKHVFLEKPLESSELNREVLKLMYGLRFKPGQPVEGGVEIYSPDPDAPAKKEATP